MRLCVAHPATADSTTRHPAQLTPRTKDLTLLLPTGTRSIVHLSTSKAPWHLWRWLGLVGHCVLPTLLSGQCARSLDLRLLRELAGSTLSAPSDASRRCTLSLTSTSPRQVYSSLYAFSCSEHALGTMLFGVRHKDRLVWYGTYSYLLSLIHI